MDMLSAARPSARSSTGRRRPAAAAIAAIILLTAAVVVAIPPARHAVAGLLGLRGERIELRQPGVPLTTAAPDTLQLGPAVTLSQARARVPELLAPTDPALLFPTWILADPQRPEVSFVFGAASGRVTTLVAERRADAGPFFAKMLGPQASLEAARVNGGPGAWVSGPVASTASSCPSDRLARLLEIYSLLSPLADAQKNYDPTVGRLPV